MSDPGTPNGPQPQIAASAYVHPSAVVIGDVRLHDESSVWPTAVLRADGDVIEVGAQSNVQDGAIVHVDEGFPVRIGARVTVGHRAVLHGCTVEDDALIGMGAIVLNGAVIGAGAVIAAGALVPEGATIAPGALVVGLPARRVREVTPEEQARFRAGVAHYVARAAEYKKKNKD